MIDKDFPFTLDKTALKVTSLFEESDEKAYWLSKTPAERLLAMEFMRQIAYGHDPSIARLQRIFAVYQLKAS